ncbi:hypothetical protein LOD99_8615 [Oopsacas minuta]|uniref:Uncharacterized protein n=1 Tax=Oopsacas minuta TaxID=111878 RepID=A0AAV7JFW7_9METZ|nr:hypothetical protein LOD99_8615 [Oopsacas minuta]
MALENSSNSWRSKTFRMNHWFLKKKIILPPLYIKLGLMKQFVKSLDKDGSCFKYICRSFPAMSNEKLKTGIFDGPQIRSPIRNTGFVQSMTNLESSACCAFWVVNNFFGNNKVTKHIDLVNDMLSKFKDLGVNMSIKVHYLFSHLDHFLKTLGI